MFMNIRICN